MPSPNATQITPPRVPMIDAQTGYVSREWYRWFYSLYNVVGAGTGIVPITGGGTGLSTIPTDGQLLIGDGAKYRLNTLTGGQNIGILNGAGTIAVGLTGEVPVVNGGTGANNATDARANLEAAKSGDNSDITSLSGITGGVETPSYIQMNVTPTVTLSLGKLSWNSTDQTLDVGMEYDVSQQVGLEYYARVQNNTGVTIPNGTVVGFTGAVPDSALSVSPYLADGASPSLYVVGVMTHDLPDTGQKGYCTAWGFVRNVDTSAFTLGDILYASPTVAGAFTNIKPTAPQNVIPIAAVLTVGATDGVIFVRPTIEQQQYYAVILKTTSQTPTAINTENLLTFDSIQIGNGVAIGAPTSRITVPQAGLYKFDAPIQLTSGSASAKNVWIWFKKNGVAIPNSARLTTTDINNGYVAITLAQTISLTATDYVEIAFASDLINVTVSTVAATAFAPAAPAIVLSVTQVQQ